MVIRKGLRDEALIGVEFEGARFVVCGLVSIAMRKAPDSALWGVRSSSLRDTR